MATLQQPQIQSGAISSTLKQVKGRLRRERWIRQASLGALVGVGLSLAIVALDKFDLVPDWLMLEWFIPFSVLIGVGVATVTAFSQPISTMEAARMAELRLGLKERFSSALEFERFGRQEIDPDQATLLRLQQQDALAHARSLKASDAAPFRLPWQTKALLGATVLLIAVILLPHFPGVTPASEVADRAVVQKEGEKLEQRARLIEKQAEMQHLEGTRQVAQQMRKLGQVMARGHLDKQRALKRYSKLTQEMADLQRKLQGAQANASGGGKSLAEAGRQLEQALADQNAGGRNPQSPSGQSPSDSAAQKGKPGAKDGKAGGKPGDKNFNIPGAQNGGPSNPSGQDAHGPQTPEMKKAVEGIKKGETQSLSEQLRQLAKRTESGQMSPQDREATANDMQKLSDALQGTPLSETQQHAQAAADAMREGDPKKAASEMRKAADSAERESQKQKDASGMQKAQNALRKSQGEMARSSSASDVENSQSGAEDGQGSDSESDSSGDPNGQMGGGSGAQQAAMDRMMQGEGKGNGKGKGNGQGQGQGQSSEPGYENGGGGGSANKAGQGGKSQPGQGQQSANQKAAKFEGEGRKFQSLDQSKIERNAKIYLGKPQAGKEGIGRLGPLMKASPGAGNSPGAQSKVPYYNYVGPAKQSAEKAMDNEDIPPAYKGSVRKYFNSLQGQ